MGLLFLDCLMFLEPFGLLTVLPFPAWLKQFIPAYKATRVIAEVVIESLPQSVLQGFIYVSVIHHTQDGTATEKEIAMLEFAAELQIAGEEAGAAKLRESLGRLGRMLAPGVPDSVVAAAAKEESEAVYNCGV